MALVVVDEDRLLDLSRKAAILSAALVAIQPRAFVAIETDKDELVEYGAEIGQELLRLRTAAQSSPHRKDYRQ